MKFAVKKTLLCALACMSLSQQSQSFMSAQAATAATHHIVVKDLDEALCQCLNKYLPQLHDLNLLNIKSKLPAIENLRTDLLFNIKRAEKRSSFTILEQTLERVDCSKPMVAVQELKKVIAILPTKTKALLQEAITDPMVKTFLGL